MDDLILSFLIGRISSLSSCGWEEDNLLIFLFVLVERGQHSQLIPWTIAIFFMSLLSACFIANCVGKLLAKWNALWIIHLKNFQKVALNLLLSRPSPTYQSRKASGLGFNIQSYILDLLFFDGAALSQEMNDET